MGWHGGVDTRTHRCGHTLVPIWIAWFTTSRVESRRLERQFYCSSLSADKTASGETQVVVGKPIGVRVDKQTIKAICVI